MLHYCPSIGNWAPLANGRCVLRLLKCFQQSPPDLAIKKLERMRLPHWITEWLHSYLSGRKAFVRIGDTQSSVFDVTSGVLQGSVLGPLIFVLFINDVSHRLKSCKLIYADDLKIYRAITSAIDCYVLQSDDNEPLLWCSENGMLLNNSKCKCINIHTPSFQNLFQLQNQR